VGVVATKPPKKEEAPKSPEESYKLNRAGRIAGYAGSIFWNIILLIFFIFFYQYIAWYYPLPDGSVNIMPFFTSAYFAWQPILVTALIISIAANIILIVYDKFWLRQTVNCILCIIGIIVIANLLIIFPFDFSVIPDIHAGYAVPTVLRIVLIVITVGLAVGALVYFIKLILGITGQKTETEEV
jgi:magnesium-transporting ATPase (P-type)